MMWKILSCFGMSRKHHQGNETLYKHSDAFYGGKMQKSNILHQNSSNHGNKYNRIIDGISLSFRIMKHSEKSHESFFKDGY